jgi:hypothetical protein
MGAEALDEAAAAADHAAAAGSAVVEPVVTGDGGSAPAVIIQGLSKTYNPSGSCTTWQGGY